MKKALLLAVAALLTATTAHADTLETVRQRGSLKCSVSLSTPGFSSPDNAGKYQGLDPDMCRAVAAAVLGDPAKAEIVPIAPAARFTALQSGEVDILFNTTTWTLGREATNKMLFVGANYYDGQGLLVRANEVKSASDLDNGTVCTNQGSTSELNLVDFFRAKNLKNEVVAFASQEEAARAYESGRCDAFSTDKSVLYAFRTKFTEPAAHVVLDEMLSKEPLGPSVRQGDDTWFNIVKWSLYAMHAAEEWGITSANVDEVMASTTDPKILRLLGKEGQLGSALGLSDDWAYQIVKQVGAYNEVFDRNIGSGSPLKIDRGLNASWKDGGLHYAPPIR